MPSLCTLKYVGVGYAVPTCKCGWEGSICRTSREAKEQHKAHLRDDCPIGAR